MQAYNQAAPVVKDVTDTAAPYVKKGLETAGEVAAPVVKAAEPVVKVRRHRTWHLRLFDMLAPLCVTLVGQCAQEESCLFTRLLSLSAFSGSTPFHFATSAPRVSFVHVKFALHGVRAQAGVGEVENFLAQQGLNANVILDGAKKATGSASDALTSAKPALDSTVSTLSATSPVILAEYALGLAGLYYLVRAAC